MPHRNRRQHTLPHMGLTLPIRRSGNIQNDPLFPCRVRLTLLPLRHQTLDRIDRIHLPRPEAFIVPCVLAYRNRQRLTIHTRQCLLGPRLKIPLLVEHVVERKQHLLLHKVHLALRKQYRNVPHLLPHLGDRSHNRPTQNRRTPPHRSPSCNLHRGLLSPRYKDSLLQKIRRRIPAHRKLRKDHQTGAHISGAGRIFKNFLRIPGEVPHRRVDLGKRYLHPLSLTLTSPSRSTPRPPSAPESSGPSSGSSSPHTPYPARCSCQMTDPAGPRLATAR